MTQRARSSRSPRPFRDLPIRRKLVVLGWTTSISALLVSTVIFLISAYVLGRRSYQAGVEMLASIVADNLTASVSFKDPKAASETLHGLRATPTIHIACAYASDLSLLAEMTADGNRHCPATPPPDQQWVSRTTVIVVRPITFDNRRAGTLYLEGNLGRLGDQLRAQGFATVIGAMAGLIIATWVAARLHQEIADPIASLSRVSARISREGNYSVRATKAGNDEVGALVDTFNDMVAGIERREEELRAANRSKDEFLAALSHELRTPLNAIVGWLQILQTNSTDPTIVNQAIVRLDRNARAQVRLIEDLLDISRIVSGKLQLKLSAVDLVGITQAAVDVVRPSADAKHLQLGTELLPPPCFVSGDPDRLQQVLVNLLTNAVKFTPEGGRIDVRLAIAGASFTVAVRDTGIGIARGFLPQVFDRFRQADGSITRQHGGLGLGLSIARDLVNLHGGSLEVASQGIGRGATFTVTLPRLLDQNPPARAARAGPEVRLHGLSILVTDDDADSRDVARQALERAGARVVVASSASDALDVLQRETFDVLVCDIQMPDMDGCALLKTALERQSGGTIAAVAVTAHAGETEQARVRSAGYQQVVIKPYDFIQLTQAVADAAAASPRESRT
jgi:signal transduction histidine kinase/ActR/RegA family two-component response regulator